MKEVAPAVKLFLVQAGYKLDMTARFGECPLSGLDVGRPGVVQSLPGGEGGTHGGADQQDRLRFPHEPPRLLAFYLA
jgi:hypothetical protein